MSVVISYVIEKKQWQVIDKRFSREKLRYDREFKTEKQAINYFMNNLSEFYNLEQSFIERYVIKLHQK